MLVRRGVKHTPGLDMTAVPMNSSCGYERVRGTLPLPGYCRLLMHTGGEAVIVW